MKEKEEEKGRQRTGKSGTLSWRPHIMSFSLFNSMDTSRPPSVFVPFISLHHFLTRTSVTVPLHSHCPVNWISFHELLSLL